ncbi:hypothetical protein [Krasilnikoviella flava]|uniref:hypothetical protein n=1 Tax=Krasilnikoviella flava TaxID=526729 RepID=UPI001FEB89CB|nr:hypothetical protein [Krasilnikoviella flava]
MFVLPWSSGFLGAKLGTGQAAVPTLLLWRYLVAAVLLGAILGVARPARRRRRARAPSASTGAAVAPHLARPRATAHHVSVGLLSQVGYVLPVYGAIGLGV